MNNSVFVPNGTPKIVWVVDALLLLLGAGTAMLGVLTTPVLFEQILVGAVIFVCAGTIGEFFYNPRALSAIGALGLQLFATLLLLLGVYAWAHSMFGGPVGMLRALLLFGEGMLLWSYGIYAFWRIDKARDAAANTAKG